MSVPQLKPQDVIVLLKLVLYEKRNQEWNYAHLAEELKMSASEVHSSVKRAKLSRLFISNERKGQVARKALEEFLVHGLQYVFPPVLGRPSKGIPTAYSGSPLKDKVISSSTVVWPCEYGTAKGESVLPLYPSAPDASLRDTDLYELLVLVDAIRLGRVREKGIAASELQNRLAYN